MVRIHIGFYNRFFRISCIIVLCVCCIFLCSFFAFADDIVEVTENETETSILETETASHIVIDNWPAANADSASEVRDFPDEIVNVEVVRSTNPITPNDANGLKKILLQLIGNYDMVTAEYTYTSTNGYTSKQVTTESDYAWMISAGLFIVMIYCIFKLFGGLMNGKR